MTSLRGGCAVTLLLGLLLVRAAPARSADEKGLVAAARLRAISGRYLGVPYKLDCLGEGAGPDPDPLFTRKAVDCQTFVEQVMAEAIAPAEGGLDAAVRRVRYFGGKVALEARYHYCIPDWLRNPWPAIDVTARVAGEPATVARRRIDRPALLASRGGNAAASPTAVEEVRTGYIPRARIASVLGRIPDGSIGVFVLNRSDIVAGHVGFLFRSGKQVLLRHASQARKKVIEEPLTTYFGRAPKRFIGMKVLLPEMAGLARKNP